MYITKQQHIAMVHQQTERNFVHSKWLYRPVYGIPCVGVKAKDCCVALSMPVSTEAPKPLSVCVWPG